MSLPLDVPAIALMALVLLSMWLAWKATRSPKSHFHFEEMLLDAKTGKTSLSRVGQLVALSLSSWAFVYLTLAYKLSEWYFTGYMITWAGAHGFGRWLETRHATDNRGADDFRARHYDRLESDELEIRGRTVERGTRRGDGIQTGDGGCGEPGCPIGGRHLYTGKAALRDREGDDQ